MSQMVNVHVFYHRIPVLSTALVSSVALGFLVAAGTSCDFLRVVADAGEYLEYTLQNGIRVDLLQTEIGVLCETPPLFLREGDALWTMSFTFWYASMVVSSGTAILSWLLTTVFGPTDATWKALSLLAALSGVLQVPIFLMFQSTPCVEYDCQISTGCILLIISCIFWVTVVALTQCQDPPTWHVELNAWRVQNKEQNDNTLQLQPLPQEPRWRRWIKRRKWASNVGLSATESLSVSNIDGERLELIENGSYYADSNNSRLMLKVTSDRRRPEDEQKSETTFGDLEDLVYFAEEQRKMASLLGGVTSDLPDEDEPSFLLGESLVKEGSGEASNQTGAFPAETIYVRSYDEAPMQYYTENADVLDNEEEKMEVQGLLGDEKVRGWSATQNIVKISSLRALADRMKRESKRKREGYHQMADDGDSDADIEDEVDNCRSYDYTPPMTTEQLKKLSQNEAPPPMRNSRNEDLLNDWDALHAATTAGIMFPRTISIVEDQDVTELASGQRGEDDYVVLTSVGHFPDDEEQDDGMSGSTLSDSSADHEDGRRERKPHRGRSFSAANSVVSHTSLIELTIAEETDYDLRESSGEEDESELTNDYALRSTKSAPDRLSLLSSSPREELSSPLKDFLSVSEASDESPVNGLPRKVLLSGITPVDETTEESTSNSERNVSEGRPKSKQRRGRSLSVNRRNRSRVHPVYNSTLRARSAAPGFREERLSKAGIHAPAIHVVSDDSSESSASSHADRTCRSSFSRKARISRIKRMHEERRCARSLDPPNKRRPEIVFDPTLRAIFLFRKDGQEYGPDEVSL